MARGRARITDKDRGARRTIRTVRELRGPVALHVGVMGKEASQAKEGAEDTTVGEVATAHEFGLGVPERSWLRAWFDANEAQIQEDLRRVTRAILLGRLTREQALELLGLKYVAQIQQRITTSIPPPNAPSTIARKGSSTTLIDTGQFRSAITYELGRIMAKGQS